MIKIIYTILFFSLFSYVTFAQYNINTPGIPVTEDFTGFNGAGFQPSPSAGQLDSDNWSVNGFSDGNLGFGGTATTGDYARGTTNGSGRTTGGIYNNTNGEMIWIQAGGSDFTPGNLTARYQNNTGSAITSVDISYEIHCLNDQGRSNNFNFSWSLDGVIFNSESSLDYVSTEVSTGLTDIVIRNITIGGLNIPAAAFFFIRWEGNDVSGSGSRDEFGLDNVQLTGNGAVSCTGPPTAIASSVNFPVISSTSLGINWTNGDGTSRIVVIREGLPISVTPTDFTTYTASNIFGSGSDLGGGQYVIYNGGANSVNVSGLSLGTTYHVAVFEYNCAAGSEEYLSTLSTNTGNETTDNTAPADFALGDIVILGVNANNNSCSGVSGEDLISFVSFLDISSGTTFDITDNGWERVNPGQFGDTEGAYNLTYTGITTIPAGTIFTISFPSAGVAAADLANPDWSIVPLPGSNTLNMNNGGDQIFIMQGGNWTDGGAAHDATYSGGILLFGFNTRTTWAADGTTQQSNLPSDLTCANILPTGGATDFIYYNGPMTAVNSSLWFDRVADNTNWRAELNCTDYNNNFTITSIPIDNSSNLLATWTGSVSSDWFDCQNWDIRRVPNSSIDVLIDGATSLNNCEIDQTSLFATNFGNIANCSALRVKNETLRIKSSIDQLHINGNFVLEGSTAILDMNEPGADGEVFLYGNWTNLNDQSSFEKGEGRVHFMGNNVQTIITSDPSGLESYYNMTINKPLGSIINNCNQLNISNNLNFLIGLIQTTNTFDLRFGVDATATNASTFSHINGPASKQTSNSVNTTFTFPVGKGGILAPLGISTNSFDGEIFTAEYFNAIHFDAGNFNASDILEVSQVEHWELNDVLKLGTSSDVTLHWGVHSNITNLAALHVGHYYTRSPNLTDMWESEGVSNTTGTTTAGTITSNSISTYSPFTIVTIPTSLPLELLSFSAEKQNTKALLKWTIDAEEFNTNYYIERSKTGYDFETIGNVSGTGIQNSILNYDFIDNSPASGTNYYRLRINESGIISYSDIKAVSFDNYSTDIKTYPSPVDDELIIELNYLSGLTINLEIYNVLGHRLIINTISSLNSSNLYKVNTSSLLPGTYFLQLKLGNSSGKVYKFIKK